MRFLLPLVLVAIVVERGCQSLLIDEKIECLSEKLEKLLNDSIQADERRQRENIKLLQVVDQLDEKLTDTQNQTNAIIQQNSKLLQMMTNVHRRMEQISSCLPVEASGRYELKASKSTFEVYCEQELYDGGWIVIQNRFDGSVDFYRNWTDYRNGFGSLDGEFWLGLEKVHQLCYALLIGIPLQITSSNSYELLVHLEAFDGVVKYARYQKFAIGHESEQYALKTLGSYSGIAGSSKNLRNERFSTYDRDNDGLKSTNCAQERQGAWWYNSFCDQSDGHFISKNAFYEVYHGSNLNGKYQNSNNKTAMYWENITPEQGLKISKMMLREV